MTEGGTDLRILTSRVLSESPTGTARGTKRKLEIPEEIKEDNEELQRIEQPSAPKRSRRSKEGVVHKVKKTISGFFHCKSNYFIFHFLYEQIKI